MSELLAKLLVQAQTILSENSHMQLEALRLGKQAVEWKPYTTEDVIREAEKLSAFINK